MAFSFSHGDAAGAVGADGLPGAGDDAGGECEEYGGQTGDEQAMAAGEFPEVIAGAGRARSDRFVVQVAADIGGQICGGGVAAGFVLFEGFGGDGFDVAAIVLAD
jgi:hypothetical protein